ncbi:hypothetical protein F2Q69_00021326 [Brassica cretica]|uniref:Uncharacterized protein n=1 Tax=Brassica cretica TaxID=69181 RepID=A0A8S9QDV6_BRACR|nr:hypothetical protein F2Q69_00021326 [Brassica cretica]
MKVDPFALGYGLPLYSCVDVDGRNGRNQVFLLVGTWRPITYALESIGAALSRQASLRRDIASVIPFHRTSRRDVLRFSEHKIVAMFSGQALGLDAGGMCSIGALPLWIRGFGRSTQL